MTEGFNIDLEADGFRKNHLDWRKFRDTYNRVSATKLERGIKPLPFSLLLKLFGPQKVLNTFVITRQNTNDIDFYAVPPVSTGKIEEMSNGDIAITNTLNFPGNGILNISSEDKSESLSKRPKHLKRDALPVRPAFQRNIRVPGRYFPKPSTATDDNLCLSAKSYETSKEIPRTQTPRSVHSHSSNYSFRGSKGISSKGYSNLKIARGSVCKATDTLSSNPGRTPTWSGKSSAATVKSMPAINSNGYLSLRKTVAIENSPDKSAELFSLSFRVDDRDTISAGNGDWEHSNETRGELNGVKRPKQLSARQVSFPKTSVDFSAVLQGRPKTLHRRELTDSLDFAREPRARTHVGFVDTDT